MARNTAALRRPPEKELPSTPAGVYVDDATELLGVVVEHERRRGRGAQSNASGRYEPLARIAFDDGWRSLDELPPFKTQVRSTPPARSSPATSRPTSASTARSIPIAAASTAASTASRARPTPILGLSPGLDFESKLFVKPEAAELLEKELAAPGYSPKVIAIGTNTDPYQPIERRYKVMRRILEVLDRAGHPVGIVTKSALVLRDLDILARMAERKLAKVALSVTTLDRRTGAQDGAARGDADAAAGDAAPARAGRRADHRDGGAGDPGAQRHGDRAHPRAARTPPA